MKITSIFASIITLFFVVFSVSAQDAQNPVIPSYGGVYDADWVVEKPDPNQEYKVVIDIATGANDKTQPFYSLVNVARLMNLHVMGGASKEKMSVVLAIHGGAVWSILNDEEYNKKYGVDNPHVPLFKELKAAGVKIFVCSQSMIGRQLTPDMITEEVVPATSMLTTLTTYQLKGYAALKF